MSLLFSLSFFAAMPATASPASAPVKELPRIDSKGPVCTANVHTSINPGSGAYIIESIDKAHAIGCGLIVFTLDTPGGLLSTTRDIVKAILSAPLPVVVYVSPPGSVAGSAGVFITLAGHIAAMAPGTNIGAAHPVSGGGKDVEAEAGKEMAKKVENDAVAFIESIAIERHRNKEWAVKAVRESVSVPAQRALEDKVIDLIAKDMDDLLTQLEGRGVTLSDKTVVLRTQGKERTSLPMSIAHRFTNAFADPQIAYTLMTFGMLGIIMELYHPGSIFPGAFGAICLLLAFVSFQVLPISWGGVVLVLLGFALIAAEVFITSHGILGVSGGVAVTIGGLLLVNTQDPNYYVEPTFALGWWDVVPLGVTLSGIAAFLASVVLKAKHAKPQAGKEALVGAPAVVQVAIAIDGAGFVQLTGELWKARSTEALEVGADVVVERVEGLTVFVRRA
jgi:membrane-bound serine protease (ClpP class)